MFNTMTLAFFLGLIAGVIIGYMIRDLLRLMSRFVRHIIFRPTLLSLSKPSRSDGTE